MQEEITCFNFKVSTLCQQSYECTDQKCVKMHPRCLSGICIKSITDQCEEENCKKLHWNDEMENRISINGLYTWNLCIKQGECECKLAHRKWLEDICTQCIGKKNCSHKKKLIKWGDLQKQIQKNPKYKYKNTSLEDTESQLWAKSICVNFMKGLCGKIYGCEKKHITWEDFCFEQIKTTILKPCQPEHQIKINEFLQKNKFYVPLSLLFTSILKNQITQQTLQEQNTLDFLIIMDCTGSMDQWMNLTQLNLCSVIDRTRVQTNLKIRIAFVGYRDICDDEKNFSIKDFTENAEEIKSFIQQQEADGGGDLAEDLIGALEKGLELDFSKNSESILCTLLICDAPCHGPQYHDGRNYDCRNYNIAEGTLENLMKKYKEKKKKSFFYVFKINDKYTGKMVGIMEQNFSQLQYINIKEESLEFYQTLYKTLADSALKAENYKEDDSVIKVKAKYRKVIFPKLPEVQDFNYWSKFSETLRNCFDEGKTYLEIEKKPIELSADEQGMTSQIFKVRDKEWNLDLICKISNEQIKKHEQLKECQNQDEQIELQKQINQIAKESCENRFYTMAYSHQLSRQFRDFQIDNKMTNPLFLFYVSPIIYELDKPFYGSNIIYAENNIEMNKEDKLMLKGLAGNVNASTIKQLQGFQKYTNNQQNFLFHMFTAFSHFTHLITNGKLLVCDLQGYLNILTDPVIHTGEEVTCQYLKSPLNYHDTGIKIFFENQHKQCNDLCEKFNKIQTSSLQYSRVNMQLEESKNQSKISKKDFRLTRQVDDSQTQYIICYICHRQDRQNNKYIFENMFDGNVPCQKCRILLQSKLTANCLCCQDIFEYCEYEQMSQRKKVPQCCNQCLDKCFQDNETSCHYCHSKCKQKVEVKQINNKNYAFCQQSLDYLNSIQCSKCQSNYEFDILLTGEEYFSKKFKCQKCLR